LQGFGGKNTEIANVRNFGCKGQVWGSGKSFSWSIEQYFQIDFQIVNRKNFYGNKKFSKLSK
jgi:hypothetical protein